MEDAYIDIPYAKCEIVRSYKTRVATLFGFDVLFSLKGNETRDEEAVRVQLFEQNCLCEVGDKLKNDILKKTKEYLRSATATGKDHCTCIELYPAHVFNSIRANHDHIEQESQAILSFMDDGRTVLISGQALNVAIAKSQMEYQRHSSPHSHVDSNLGHLTVAPNTRCVDYTGEHISLKDPLKHTLSPGGESLHDSCYDSDTSPLSSRRNSTHIDPEYHSDVSRTTSDTLGTELDKDDVKRTLSSGALPRTHARNLEANLYSYPTTSKSCENVSSADSSKTVSQFQSKVEFALKLGYTEDQIGSVLRRLGTDVAQNEMLGELIVLGTQDLTSHGGNPNRNVCHEIGPAKEKFGVLAIGNKTPVQRKSSGGATVHSEPQSYKTHLRPIVIDGSNVAMSHGNKEVFSCRGIKLAVDWFRQRGHLEIRVVVPQWRKEASRIDSQIMDQDILYELERERILIFTPARRVAGKRVVCYDDRYILKLAAEDNAVVVSNDNYRDLINESPEFKKVIETRLLMYSFVHGAQGKTDRFMPPDDPLGRHGPSLDDFLSQGPVVRENMPQVCPYGKKCTYGNKCKYYHPERGRVPLKSVTDSLKEQATRRIEIAKQKGLLTQTNSIGDGARQLNKKPLGKAKSLSTGVPQKKGLHRTASLVPGTDPQSRNHDRGAVYPADPRTLTRSLSPNLMVTSPSGEAERLDFVECKQGNGSNYSSPRRTPSPVEQAQSAVEQYLRLPQQAGYMDGHMTLRSVLSDPTCGRGYYTQKLAQPQGMLNQSVEDVTAQLRRHSLQQRILQDELNKPFGRADFPVAEERKPVHRPLRRELSLKGAEDPRLAKAQSQQKPVVTFHGTQVPVGNHRQVPAQWYQGGYQPEHVVIMPPGMQQPLTRDDNLHRNVLLKTQNAALAMYGDDSKLAQQICDEQSRGHVPIARMSSAPGAFGTQEPQHMSKKPPMMTRQNSNSDSNLALHGLFGDPRWAFQGSISGQVRQQMERQNVAEMLQPQSRSHQSGEPLNLPGIKVAFGDAKGKKLSVDVTRQTPQAEMDAGRMTPGAPVKNSNAQPGFGTRTGASDMQVFGAPMGLQQSMRSSTAEALRQEQHSIALQQNELEKRRNMVLQQQLEMQHIELQQQQLEMQQQAQANASTQSLDVPPHPESQNPFNLNAPTFVPNSDTEDLPIQKSDPRYQIYFHLCGLFDESNVRRVMNSNPSETKPEVLISLLLPSMTPK